MVDLEELREAIDGFTAHRIRPYQDLNTLLVAARELLALKENGQTVWWCEEHRGSGEFDPPTEICWYAGVVNPAAPCRMVKASLHIHREGT